MSATPPPRMLDAVDSTEIMPQQARRLQAIVARDLRFLMRLCKRMERLGFPPDDPLYRSALMAQRAIHELHVQAHYTGCTTGVGRRSA